MDLGDRTSWDNLSKDGPITNPFHWCELLAFVEFKLEKRLLQSCLSFGDGGRNSHNCTPSWRSHRFIVSTYFCILEGEKEQWPIFQCALVPSLSREYTTTHARFFVAL